MGYEWFLAAWLTGVTQAEAIQVLYCAGHRWPRPILTKTGLTAVSVWGRTDTGRGAIVYLRQLDGRDYQIIGATLMTEEQQAEFTEWEALQ